jgi:hypothetical protein
MPTSVARSGSCPEASKAACCGVIEASHFARRHTQVGLTKTRTDVHQASDGTYGEAAAGTLVQPASLSVAGMTEAVLTNRGLAADPARSGGLLRGPV